MDKRNLTFALFGNIFQANKTVYIEQLLSLLKMKGAKLVVARDFYQYLVDKLGMRIQADGVFHGSDYEADMVLSIGGDGTFLQAASNVGERGIPILGINTGRLGFLADTSPKDMEKTFDDIFNHRYQIEERNLLHVVCPEQPLRGYPYGLNEISVLKRDSSSMISIHTTVNGIYLSTYQADGLIIATPTGSTAYSLSVGGPIIVPQSNTIAMTPVAPHSLNMRPIVLTNDCVITLEVESRSHNFLVAIDGRSETCRQGSKLIIKKAPYTVKLIKRLGHSFFDTLHNKMMWGVDGRE
ncbi:MAG: NAD kinase [Phocaeicola sp.]|uniref:NAD kinase n=1 Tax=Phocaeicola TaxID=909656 RepID=UPI00234F45B1|nr:NAD kinase [Phocaeicola oris]MCE2617503.1 NAD kinase [Phocaeicola oris]